MLADGEPLTDIQALTVKAHQTLRNIQDPEERRFAEADAAVDNEAKDATRELHPWTPPPTLAEIGAQCSLAKRAAEALAKAAGRWPRLAKTGKKPRLKDGGTGEESWGGDPRGQADA